MNIAIYTYRFVGVFFIPSTITNSLSLPSKRQKKEIPLLFRQWNANLVANKLNVKFFPFEASTQIAFSFSVFIKHLIGFENFTIRSDQF